jgi:hypothetical protein
MSRMVLAMAVLALVLIGLAGCDSNPRTTQNANPTRVAGMQQDLRLLWLGHIFWVQHAVLSNATSNLTERDVAEQKVMANAKQIADMVMPFYGEMVSEKLFVLLAGHYAAVKEYSEATVAEDRRQQDAALACLASNADDIAVFLSGVNPYLRKDTVQSLVVAHGAHHILQINQYKKKDYARLEESWPMMRQHVYVIADTLTAALAKQFPSQFL